MDKRHLQDKGEVVGPQAFSFLAGYLIQYSGNIRKGKFENCPGAVRRLNPDFSPMTLYNALAQRQADPCPRKLILGT